MIRTESTSSMGNGFVTCRAGARDIYHNDHLTIISAETVPGHDKGFTFGCNIAELDMLSYQVVK